MQSNLNRLRNVIKLSKYLLFAIGILTIIFNVNDIDALSSIISILWIVVSIFYSWFDKSLWKKNLINSKLKVSNNYYCPSIGGRWEGTLTRDNTSHEFVIEIKQTYTTISCETYSKNSYSKSICAELLYDSQNDYYSLVFCGKVKLQKVRTGKISQVTILWGQLFCELVTIVKF